MFAKRCEIIDTILRKCVKKSETELAYNSFQKVKPITQAEEEYMEKKVKIKYEESVKQEELILESDSDETYGEPANENDEDNDETYFEKSDNIGSRPRRSSSKSQMEKETLNEVEYSPTAKRRTTNRIQIKPKYCDNSTDESDKEDDDQYETYAEKSENLDSRFRHSSTNPQMEKESLKEDECSLPAKRMTKKRTHEDSVTESYKKDNDEDQNETHSENSDDSISKPKRKVKNWKSTISTKKTSLIYFFSFRSVQMIYGRMIVKNAGKHSNC